MTNNLIIGAGLKSIRLALYLKKRNLDYEIFEKYGSIGGVFSNDFIYPDLKLHTYYKWFFLDLLAYYHPHWLKKCKNKNLSQKEVCRYLSEVVETYNLNVKLNHEVIDISEKKNYVIITYLDNNKKIKNKKFNKVYLPPDFTKMKEYINSDNYNIISKHIYEIDVNYIKNIPKDKKILVVGGGKAGVDMIESLYKNLNLENVTWLIRTPRLFMNNWKGTFNPRDRCDIYMLLLNLFGFRNNLITTPYYDEKKLTTDKHFYFGNLFKETNDILHKLKKNQIIYGYYIDNLKDGQVNLKSNHTNQKDYFKTIDIDYIIYCTGTNLNRKKTTKRIQYVPRIINELYYFDEPKIEGKPIMPLGDIHYNNSENNSVNGIRLESIYGFLLWVFEYSLISAIKIALLLYVIYKISKNEHLDIINSKKIFTIVILLFVIYKREKIIHI